MKYDIAKNEDGPLRRTMKPGALPTTDTGQPTTSSYDIVNHTVPTAEDYPSAERYPGLDERLQNIEKHLAVRYGRWKSLYAHSLSGSLTVGHVTVPSPPRLLLDRLKYLEDHIIHLEREYPPWAALHFSQPNRGVRAPSFVAR